MMLGTHITAEVEDRIVDLEVDRIRRGLPRRNINQAIDSDPDDVYLANPLNLQAVLNE
jgi:hypothetical protein